METLLLDWQINMNFIFDNWHAWTSNGEILLADEVTMKLRSFENADKCINWLFVNGYKPAARALHKTTQYK